MSKHILIVDDDREIVDLISIGLQNEGFIIYKAFDGEKAYKIFQEKMIHLMILDIMMPKMNGLELCSNIRKRHKIPILMVSAKSGDLDKIQGLMTGADDYLIKPFNLLELVMRVKALIRRTYDWNENKEKDGIVQIDSLVIDRNKYSVFIGNEKINMTAKEFEILYLLTTHKGQVLSSEAIFQLIWKEKYYDSNNTVMVHISNIREKIDKYLGYKLIRTIWGVGYKIEG